MSSLICATFIILSRIRDRLAHCPKKPAAKPQTLARQPNATLSASGSQNVSGADVFESLRVTLHGRDNSSNLLKRRGGGGESLKLYAARGCQILVAPFDITIRKCAVIRDPFGTRLCILDTTKGLRPPNLAEPQGLM